MFIDSFWSYIHLDVLEEQWNKLVSNLKVVREFEELRKLLDAHINSITQ